MAAQRTTWTAIAILTGSVAVAAAQSASPDYPQWRGRNRDGAAASFVEPKAWPDKMTLKWKGDVGPGYATPLVVPDRIYTHTRKDENEAMMALDATTGTVIWPTSYPAPSKVNRATQGHDQRA